MNRILQKATLHLAGDTMLRLCVCAALSGAMAATMFAADGAHVRSHHVTRQSAGAQETHGRIHETASTRQQEREVVASRSKHRGPQSAARQKGAVEQASARKNVSRAHGKTVEVAESKKDSTTSRVSRRNVSRKSVHARTLAKVVDAPQSKKAVTVGDFLRAAKQDAPKTNSGVVAEGVSRPDTSNKIETESASRKSVSVMATRVPQTAAHRRVVQGFGGEVDVVQEHSANATNNKKSEPARDDWKSADSATQREIATAATQPMVVPLFTRSGKLITPAPLKGTHEILVHQNTMADQEGLSRIQDDADLNRMRDAHLLARIPETSALDVNDALPLNRRYARPWTVKFVGDLSRAYYSRFHEPLRLNSAVRTVDFQVHLQRINGNAAPASGDTASPHLTGQAIDFGKKGMSHVEIAWMRAYLIPLMHAGKIDVEEEFQQSCFHISVYGSYAPKMGDQRMDVAEGQ